MQGVPEVRIRERGNDFHVEQIEDDAASQSDALHHISSAFSLGETWTPFIGMTFQTSMLNRAAPSYCSLVLHTSSIALV